jgi:ubiquitin-conjugating enzyme E2 variant
MNKGKGNSTIPRSFVLLDELEKGEKGQYSPYCTIGMKDMRDVNLKEWNGIIITHPDSAVGEQFINFDIVCEMKYPDVAPVFKFASDFEVLNLIRLKDKTHILKSYIGSNKIVSSKLSILQNWDRHKRMIDVMNYLKKMIETNSSPAY